MPNNKIQKARQLIKNKPYLMWYTQSYDKLSPESILENVISHGDWPDFLELVEIFGVKQSANIFNRIISKKRNNLKPKTISLFTRYFKKYA